MLTKIFTLPTSNQTVSNPIFTLNVNMAEIPKFSRITKAVVTFKAGVGFTWLSPTIKIQIIDSTGAIKYTSPEKAVPKQPQQFTFNKLQSYFTPDEAQWKVQIMGTGTYRYWEVIDAQLEISYEPPTFEIQIGNYTNGTIEGKAEIITITPDTIISRTLKAIPNSRYKFLKWQDNNGNVFTDPQLNISISDQTISAHKTIVTYTPIFIIEFDPLVYVGKTKLKTVYLGTTPVKEIYIGTKKIY